MRNPADVYPRDSSIHVPVDVEGLVAKGLDHPQELRSQPLCVGNSCDKPNDSRHL